MEVLFWVGMYVLVALIFYVAMLHEAWIEGSKHNGFSNTGYLVLAALGWPVISVLTPFYLVHKVYEQTRKKIE